MVVYEEVHTHIIRDMLIFVGTTGDALRKAERIWTGAMIGHAECE